MTRRCVFRKKDFRKIPKPLSTHLLYYNPFPPAPSVLVPEKPATQSGVSPPKAVRSVMLRISASRTVHAACSSTSFPFADSTDFARPQRWRMRGAAPAGSHRPPGPFHPPYPRTAVHPYSVNQERVPDAFILRDLHGLSHAHFFAHPRLFPFPSS